MRITVETNSKNFLQSTGQDPSEAAAGKERAEIKCWQKRLISIFAGDHEGEEEDFQRRQDANWKKLEFKTKQKRRKD